MHELLYGRNPVYESLRAGRRHFYRLQIAQGVKEKGRLADILQICRQKKIPLEASPRERLDARVPGNQGVILEASEYPTCDLQDILDEARQAGDTAFILILDSLQDPQNLGTLLRTAEAVGVQGVLLPLRQTALVTPAVVNASSGACEHLLVSQINLAQAIQHLKSQAIWVVGLEDDPAAQIPKQVDLSVPLALVVGSEGRGMRRLVREACDILMRLPMRGKIDSLNAAVAGSIGLYLAYRARNEQQV
jgi:23S rRNA (guanosine2251-2'-O)-methyltransferase